MTQDAQQHQQQQQQQREAHRALVGAGVGVDDVVFDRWGSWAVLRMPGFAGPQTEWRAIALHDDVGTLGVRRGDTYEAFAGTYHTHSVTIDVEVDTPDERELGLEKSAAGATLTEILAETRKQRATVDVAVAMTIVRALVDIRASVDDVLVGYDGALYLRRRAWSPIGSVPSWAWERRAADADRARFLVALLSALGLRSRERADVEPRMTTSVNDLVASLQSIARVRDAIELEVWRAEVDKRLAVLLSTASATVDAHVLASLVRELFAERWHSEQRVLEAVLG